MNTKETSHAIDQAAAEWVAREDRGPLNQEETEALSLWLDGDMRRPGALLRARALWMQSASAEALGPQYDPAAMGAITKNTGLSRRQWLLGLGGGVACVVGGGVVLNALSATQVYATDIGEMRLVPLEDGSTIRLNTNTKVQIRYDKTERYVRLIRGEADFTIKTNQQHPFVIETGEAQFVSTGGALRLRKLSDMPLDVLVHQGQVDMRSKAGKAAIQMAGYTRLVLSPQATDTEPVTPQVVDAKIVDRELAWREGKIAFEGEPLSEAVSVFSRYNHTPIIIEDTRLASEPVIGLFSANDPMGFSQAIAGVFGAQVVRRQGRIILTRQAVSTGTQLH